MLNRILGRTAGVAATACMQTAIAGPPLVTDDTGTAAPGVLEILAYASHEDRKSGESTEGPALDLAYGIDETIEVSLVIPRQRVQDAGEPSITGWGEAAISVKWRFFDRADRALAIGPSFAAPLSSSSTIRGLIADTAVFTLPLVGSITRDRWEFNGNLGYSISSREFDAISLSASAGYAVTPNIRLLAEIWGVDFVNDGASEGFVNWRAGLQWSLSEDLSLLGAYGSSVWTQLGSENELQHDYFIGIQYNFGQSRADP